MIFRDCAGGVVFFEDRVFLLRNDKHEWVLPKGVVRDKRLKQDVALERVRKEAGIEAEIISPAGETSYEFYSMTRHQPVCNRITWYVMRANSALYRIAFEQGFTDGDYFPIDEALERVTYSQDKALVSVAHEKYRSQF
ncbi:NUDIX domain-containing protein [Bacillota bacterium Meth-B3]|nr:NUDIX hydrolase [Christensenellaceae bacterium]MEA5068150.1 NUDIX hydrolase [Christensenellaceae bacterium]